MHVATVAVETGESTSLLSFGWVRIFLVSHIFMLETKKSHTVRSFSDGATTRYYCHFSYVFFSSLYVLTIISIC
jgi:hypothetical protein